MEVKAKLDNAADPHPSLVRRSFAPNLSGYEHALADVLTFGLTPTLPPSRRPMDCIISGLGISLPITVALPFPILTGFPVNPRPSVGHQRVNLPVEIAAPAVTLNRSKNCAH